jgi:hypothetical protein
VNGIRDLITERNAIRYLKTELNAIRDLRGLDPVQLRLAFLATALPFR